MSQPDNSYGADPNVTHREAAVRARIARTRSYLRLHLHLHRYRHTWVTLTAQEQAEAGYPFQMAQFVRKCRCGKEKAPIV